MSRYKIIDGPLSVFWWIALPTLVASTCAAGLARNLHTQPWPVSAALVVVPLAWFLIAGLRWIGRVEYMATISFYTSQGVRVRLGVGPWLQPSAVESLVYQALDLGRRYGRVTMEDFDGVTVTVIEGKVQTPGGLAWGATQGKDITIAHVAGDVEADLLDRIHHEFGHYALNVAGAPADQEQQHDIFRKAGYGT